MEGEMDKGSYGPERTFPCPDCEVKGGSRDDVWITGDYIINCTKRGKCYFSIELCEHGREKDPEGNCPEQCILDNRYPPVLP
jgi:hypothetical protein